MLVISKARRTGLLTYQRLWLEAMERYSKPIVSKPTVFIFDDWVAHAQETRQAIAAKFARRARPALCRAASRQREVS